MLGSQFSHRFEVYLTACGAHVKQELFCKSTILDIGQDLLHCFLGIFGNDLRTCDVIAIFSSAIMRLLGFEYESVGGFILYFIIASIVSYPMNLVAGAFPKALLNLDRITRKMAVCMYVLLDTITTFFGFYIVDYLFVCSGGILPYSRYKRQYIEKPAHKIIFLTG